MEVSIIMLGLKDLAEILIDYLRQQQIFSALQNPGKSHWKNSLHDPANICIYQLYKIWTLSGNNLPRIHYGDVKFKVQS